MNPEQKRKQNRRRHDRKRESKSFVLVSGSENGHAWQIQCKVLRRGVFDSKGKILTAQERGAISAKERDLGFHKISFQHKGCVWHHVNDNDVVATPERIHRLMRANHRALEGVLG